ncbi:MAG: DUF1697 domain-containing protein [Solirubrobacteraceae bacterium]
MSRLAAVVLLLRGINLGPNRRVPMAALREELTQAGFADVRTYVQSGNVVARSDLTPADAQAAARRAIKRRFGLDVPVLARTRDELAAVVHRNPLADVATEPKRHQVSFLSEPVSPQAAQRLQAAVLEPEALAIDGREIHAWHPDGIARSKLAIELARAAPDATARNWRTVTTLLAICDEAQT